MTPEQEIAYLKDEIEKMRQAMIYAVTMLEKLIAKQDETHKKEMENLYKAIYDQGFNVIKNYDL